MTQTFNLQQARDALVVSAARHQLVMSLYEYAQTNQWHLKENGISLADIYQWLNQPQNTITLAAAGLRYHSVQLHMTLLSDTLHRKLDPHISSYGFVLRWPTENLPPATGMQVSFAFNDGSNIDTPELAFHRVYAASQQRLIKLQTFSDMDDETLQTHLQAFFSTIQALEQMNMLAEVVADLKSDEITPALSPLFVNWYSKASGMHWYREP